MLVYISLLIFCFPLSNFYFCLIFGLFDINYNNNNNKFQVKGFKFLIHSLVVRHHHHLLFHQSLKYFLSFSSLFQIFFVYKLKYVWPNQLLLLQVIKIQGVYDYNIELEKNIKVMISLYIYNKQ